jgi:hypothetical protein
LLRAIILSGAVAAGLAVYFLFSLYVFPMSYQASDKPPRPEPVTDVQVMDRIPLGQSLNISVTSTNRGDKADMQIVSIGFPNLTRSEDAKIVGHDFLQTPNRINPGEEVGSGYSGTEAPISAQYPYIEAFSRPWEAGRTFKIDIAVQPQAEGNFLLVVKSVAFPHSWDGAHYPRQGTMDYQREFVQQYIVQVTKP